MSEEEVRLVKCPKCQKFSSSQFCPNDGTKLKIDVLAELLAFHKDKAKKGQTFIHKNRGTTDEKILKGLATRQANVDMHKEFCGFLYGLMEEGKAEQPVPAEEPTPDPIPIVAPVQEETSPATATG